MRFGRISIREAEGAVLAHGVTKDGLAFKKGRKLSAADVAALTKAGITTVMAARFEQGDVPEDVAAHRVAEAARGPNVELSAAFTGRANLYATAHGLALIDAPRIDVINNIDESLTIATIAPFDVVEPRSMLATVKVIPFAAHESDVEEAVAAAALAPLIQVAPFAPKRIVLISTMLPGMKPSLLDKNASVISARAAALGSEVIYEARCAHDEQEIAKAIRESAAHRPEITLVFGASATTDRLDAVPAGIVAAGGEIEHFGMPVDPGNLLLLARLNGEPIIGLPGCARSPKVNGFDFVLQRLCAEIPITPRDIMGMGVGGLLKEIPTRPQPRDATPAAAPRAAKIAAIVLAAGKSSRMGSNKLLMPIKGKPMIARTVDAVLESSAHPIVCVTGNAKAEVEKALADRDVSFTHNAHFAEGLSTSLRAGLAALPQDVDGAIVCLGDMPAVTGASINQMIAAFNPAEGRAIIVPAYQGKRGNPVLFARTYFAEIAAVHGDVGAKPVIAEHDDEVYEIEAADASVLADADTPAAFAALETQIKP
ncbi:MAG: NTP transferase domain-containing protein [Alphaproteobacteria bacterium]|nr:NTP transferase domain-containing protein [Alphaproteobacteria bacterium]